MVRCLFCASLIGTQTRPPVCMLSTLLSLDSSRMITIVTVHPTKPPRVTLWPWQKKRLLIPAEHVIKARPAGNNGRLGHAPLGRPS